MSHAVTFHALHQGPDMLVPPDAWDAASAALIGRPADAVTLPLNIMSFAGVPAAAGTGAPNFNARFA